MGSLLVLASPAVMACSTCMVGDPTLSLMGAEKPFEGRLRLSMDVQSRREELGVAGFNRKVIDETRYSLSLAYAPTSRWMLGINLPWVQRQLERFDLSHQTVNAMGDVSMFFKYFLQQDERDANHRYGLLSGIKFATAEQQFDSSTLALDFDVQPGQGANVLNLGLWHAWFHFPWQVYSSASIHVADQGFEQFQAGQAVTANVHLQYALNYDLALYAGLEGRSSERDQFEGIDDPDSGGSLVYLSPGLVITLQPDLLLNVTYKIPLLNRLNGDHEEKALFFIGVTYDFPHH